MDRKVMAQDAIRYLIQKVAYILRCTILYCFYDF